MYVKMEVWVCLQAMLFHFKFLNTRQTIIFITRGTSMKGTGTIGSLKWELSQFKTHDRGEFNVMLLRKTKGTYWAELASSKVCIELQRASLMPFMASAPGFNFVTSPVETGLFGFSQLHQTSQSITILHGYPLSQQRLINRLKWTPNLNKFAGKAGYRWDQWECEKKITDIMWKSSIENMEKYVEVCCGIQMDVMTSYDTDFQSAKGSGCNLTPQFCVLIQN